MAEDGTRLEIDECRKVIGEIEELTSESLQDKDKEKLALRELNARYQVLEQEF